MTGCVYCCSDIKGALSSLLRTISNEADTDTSGAPQADKNPAVARDGADSRPLSATPSILGGPAARRTSKPELAGAHQV